MSTKRTLADNIAGEKKGLRWHFYEDSIDREAVFLDVWGEGSAEETSMDPQRNSLEVSIRIPNYIWREIRKHAGYSE
jgi:hypothetical protein